MSEAMQLILMDIIELCDSNAMAIQQVMMLGAEGFTQTEKDERKPLLDMLITTHNGCQSTLARIKSIPAA